jgi:D-lactate dehydrogenase
MHVTVFSAHAFERDYLTQSANGQHEFRFLDAPLSLETAKQAQGSQAVAVFTNDDASAPVLEQLHAVGVRYVAARAAGYDNVDLAAAHRLGIRVANVPVYSPYAIGEHTVALILALNRRLHLADQQLRANDFRLDNLIGFDLHGKTVGIIGCGRIGGVVARIMHGFGCQLLGYDVAPDASLSTELGLTYTTLEDLCARADVITLHAPLNGHTHYLINKEMLSKMKPGVMLINTGRGGVLNTQDALAAMQSGQLGYLGLDVYEHEKGLFFNDRTRDKPHDETFAQLLAQPNVLITGHQAFLTREALTNIADATINSLTCWENGQPSTTEL